jgi:DNA-binding NtrC family response regulator
MPGMDGIELLRRVKSTAPETVRVMLTGNAETETAIEAINEGSIFRFLIKPVLRR